MNAHPRAYLAVRALVRAVFYTACALVPAYACALASWWAGSAS